MNEAEERKGRKLRIGLKDTVGRDPVLLKDS